jgi:acyl carrier protein
MTAEPGVTKPDQPSLAETTIRILTGLVKPESVATLTDDTGLFLGLGLSSRQALELLMRLEDELGIDLTTTALDWRHLETIGSLKRYLAERVEAGG